MTTPTDKASVAARFFIDHGMIHDRASGQHVCTEQSHCEVHGTSLQATCAMLNDICNYGVISSIGVLDAEIRHAEEALAVPYLTKAAKREAKCWHDGVFFARQKLRKLLEAQPTAPEPLDEAALRKTLAKFVAETDVSGDRAQDILDGVNGHIWSDHAMDALREVSGVSASARPAEAVGAVTDEMVKAMHIKSREIGESRRPSGLGNWLGERHCRELLEAALLHLPSGSGGRDVVIEGYDDK